MGNTSLGSWVGSWFGWGDFQRRILLLGLDSAGKTTILYRLHQGEVVMTTPTTGFNVETVTYRNLKFEAWDLAGQGFLRPLWSGHLAMETDVLVYIVDASDLARLAVSCQALFAILQEPVLDGKTLLVLANKQDLPGAKSTIELTHELRLHQITHMTWKVFETVATDPKHTGLTRAFDWLVAHLQSTG